MIAADLRKRRPKPHTHLDEVYLKINGRMVYLWRAVDAEGEVLDVLVQSRRNTRAALKLKHKLLKKYGTGPEKLITDDCGPIAPQRMSPECRTAISVVDGATIEPRTRINRPDDESARCRVSREPVSRKAFSRSTQPPTTSSMSKSEAEPRQAFWPDGARYFFKLAIHLKSRKKVCSHTFPTFEEERTDGIPTDQTRRWT